MNSIGVLTQALANVAPQDVVLQSMEISFEGSGGMIRVHGIEITERLEVQGRQRSDIF